MSESNKSNATTKYMQDECPGCIAAHAGVPGFGDKHDGRCKAKHVILKSTTDLPFGAVQRCKNCGGEITATSAWVHVQRTDGDFDCGKPPAPTSAQEIDLHCPGCGVLLTPENAGGYQLFCETCVKAMPPLPEGGGWITGKYPNFKWVTEEPDWQSAALQVLADNAARRDASTQAGPELTLETVLWAAANFISCAPDHRPPDQREAVLKGLTWAIESFAAKNTPTPTDVEAALVELREMFPKNEKDRQLHMMRLMTGLQSKNHLRSLWC